LPASPSLTSAFDFPAPSPFPTLPHGERDEGRDANANPSQYSVAKIHVT